MVYNVKSCSQGGQLGCSLKEKYCENNQIATSTYSCPSWCVDGAYRSCIDKCYSSWPSCSFGTNSSWCYICGNFGSDSCLEWDPVNYCPFGSICSCQNGNCSCI